jgi:hypothetical protein
MKLQIIYCLLILLFLTSCTPKIEKNYPEADAVYLKRVKTYHLNTDGSITTSEEKQQKLLTYRAFQSLFGDTHIFFNPDFQTVDVKSAFTIMADGKKVEVPGNGINDILPGWCAGSEAYNRLREKVITHTALERNAVINCAWSVNTAKGVVPCLAGTETISSDCPVENYAVVVEVPEGVTLNYQLINSAVQPETKQKDGFKTFTWRFTDIPQHLAENNEPVNSPTVPVLLFSTQSDGASILKWLSTDGVSDEAVASIKKETQSLTPAQKVLKAQEIIANEVNTLFIPAPLTAFKSRAPREVWLSNSGTPFEKCNLLASVIRSQGANAEVCIKYPAYCNDEQLPFHLLAEPLVKVNLGRDTLYLSATHQNRNASEFLGAQTIIRSLSSNFKQINSLRPSDLVKITGEMKLSRNGKINGKISSEYSNSSVPWYSLLANQANVPDKQINSKAKIEELSEHKLVVSSVIDASLSTERGGYLFVTIPENHEVSASIIPSVLSSERINPVALPCPINESYHFQLQLPENSSLVNSLSEEISNSIGTVKISFSQKEDKITIDKHLIINNQSINPKEYSQFKQLMDKWRTPQFKELVICTK